MKSRVSSEAGLGLIGLILWIGLLAFLLLVLQLQVTNLAFSAGGLEAQLYSFVLAENGLEFARSVMQAMEPQELMAGRDGILEQDHAPGWRNPLSFSQARTLELEGELDLSPDDGFPWDPETGRGHSRLRFSKGQAIIRFSNNPEEAPDQDRDGELVVRSMGVVPSSAPFPAYFGNALRNQVTLLEARFRHSRFFRSPAPLMLWNSEVAIEGQPVLVSDEQLLVGYVSSESSSGSQGDRLREELAPVLDEPAQEIRDLTTLYQEDAHQSVMFQPDFWSTLLARLPQFIDDRVEDRIFHLDGGGTLRGPWQGLIVAKGDVLLDSDFSLTGLLLHVGSAELRLRSGCTVQGAIWKISETPEVSGRITLEGEVTIEYEPDEVVAALSLLPADLAGFRIIFPEMRQ